MTIIKYENGKCRAVVRLKGRHFAETFDTYDEAKNFEQRKTSEILNLSSKAVFDKVPSLTFEQALKQYFASSSFTKKRPSTQKTELVKAKSLLKHFAQYPVSSIHPFDVQEYFDLRSKQSTYFNDNKTVRNDTVRPDTLRLEKVVLSNLFKYLNKFGIIQHNPIKSFEYELEQPTQDYDVISSEDLLNFLQTHPKFKDPYAEDVWNAWFNVTFFTAMRPGETVNLLVDYFDKEASALVIPSKSQKNKRPHLVNLIPGCVFYIERQIERAKKDNSPYIFYSFDRAGKPIPFNYAYYWRRVKLEAGITKPIKPHQLRHTAITNLAKDGGFSLHELMTVTGHTTVASLKRYMHLHALDYKENVTKVSDIQTTKLYDLLIKMHNAQPID